MTFPFLDASTEWALDVLALGEALVDLISKQTVLSLSQAVSFDRFVGGEVTNVAMNVAKLGGRAAVVACVGDDGFGTFIRRELESAGVNATCLQTSSRSPTTVAINGRQTATPDFIIYRGADSDLSLEEACVDLLRSSRVVHTSAFALSREPARTATLDALQVAREDGCLVSLDPNYHPHIWPDVADFQAVLQEAYQFVHITKPSLDDCVRLFGSNLSPLACAHRFLDWGPDVVALTMGRQGVLLVMADGGCHHIVPGDTVVADVTGAGDAFWAGLIVALLDGYPIDDAACVGQMVAEAKIGVVGPVAEMPDRIHFYGRLQSAKDELVARPPHSWMLT
jgi:fructokinase